MGKPDDKLEARWQKRITNPINIDDFGKVRTLDAGKQVRT